MDSVKSVVAKNLVNLRKANNLTQSAVAAKLNYSDKSVSKWERGEALPDLDTLVGLASFYGVTLDYLTDPESVAVSASFVDAEKDRLALDKKRLAANRLIISSMVVVSAYLIATLAFIYGSAFSKVDQPWMAFVWAVPASAFALQIFLIKWKGEHLYFLIVESILCWSLLASVYLQLKNYGFWYFFLAGIPVEALLILNHLLKTR